VLSPSHPPPVRRIATAALIAGCLLATLPACGGGTEAKSKLTIFAASSLTESFDQLERAYEKEHPGVDIVISYGSSTELADQITQGAPADVIATADANSIGTVDDAGLLDGAPQQFTSNTLAIVTPADNPAAVASIDDLNDVDFVTCDPSAPCGAAASSFLKKAGISAAPVSLEADVKSVLSKVTLGEADAGIVYVTDSVAAGEKVTTVAIPADLNVVNPYFLGVVKASDAPDLAGDWIALVMSQVGHRVLADAGFGVQ
jgi:molybdate transport system substrate-binding protein